MESQYTSQSEDDEKNVATRDGSLFIIDTSPEIFESAESGDSYFMECLEAYQKILSRKLLWNRRDWMGLLLYNTKLQDDPTTENIHTLRNFGEVTTDMIIDISYISEHKENYYKKNAVSSDNSLHDVLWHACRCFDSVKVAMELRQVVLLTRRDNPLPENETERHKIRHRAKKFHDLKVNLRIIGLGDEWNDELFYKDIQVLANNMNPADVKRSHLKDLETQMSFPARVSGHLKLQIGDELEIPTFITSFSCKTKYLKTARMHKDTNEILDVIRYWKPLGHFGDDSEEENDQSIIKSRVPSNMQKVVKFGGKTICFQPQEVKKMRVTKKPGISLIVFKPISLDLHYHIKPTRFLSVENSASKGQKELFAALLTECEEKSLMAICAVSHRSAPYLAKMIPCPAHAGFYLYKLPFREQINDLTDYTKSYIYDELPIDEEGTALMKKITRKIKIYWNPQAFSNPKLIAELAYIEALALDKEFIGQSDSTLPDKTTIASRISKLIGEYEKMFGENIEEKPRQSVKRAARPDLADEELIKAVKFDDKIIQKLLKNKELDKVSVKVLKYFLKSIGESTNGLKIDLIKRITEYYRNGSH